MSKHPIIEVEVPGATTEDLRTWGENVLAENPISHDEKRSILLEVSHDIFMGIGLRVVHEHGHNSDVLGEVILAATRPTAAESQVMEENAA